MRTLVGKDENDWVDLAWTWIHTRLRPDERVFIPAGGTPTALYRRFMREPSDLLSRLNYVQIDEIMTGPKRGIFRAFFEAELPIFRSRIEWIGEAAGEADAAILGVGVNGHVAFHEPGLPRSFAAGGVRLTETTLRYLELSDPTWGLTYGVASFLRASRILVLARGEAKRAVLRRALAERDLPVSWILEHPDVTLITDGPV
jgi:6-phosphogluconolactonase/glucosamine-6-phosphate isomerase/deaminase